MEEILTPLQLRCRSVPHVGIQIWVRYCSRYATAPSESKADLSRRMLLPLLREIPKLRRPRAIIDPTVIQTLQKTSKKFQDGSNVQTYG